MDIFIRPAGPADAEDIADVQRLSWQAAYGGLLSRQSLARAEQTWGAAHWRTALGRIDERNITLVLDSEFAGVTGFITAGRRRSSDPRLKDFDSEIYLLYLLPWVQGGGNGRRLMTGMANVLRARGQKSVLVWALAGNNPAIAFYSKLNASMLMQWRRPFFGEAVDEIAFGWTDIDLLAKASPNLQP